MYGVPQWYVFFVFVVAFFVYSKQLKGPDTTTLYKPPSHHLFNAQKTTSWAK